MFLLHSRRSMSGGVSCNMGTRQPWHIAMCSRWSQHVGCFVACRSSLSCCGVFLTLSPSQTLFQLLMLLMAMLVPIFLPFVEKVREKRKNHEEWRTKWFPFVAGSRALQRCLEGVDFNMVGCLFLVLHSELLLMLCVSNRLISAVH